jgi:hypothetical protein
MRTRARDIRFIELLILLPGSLRSAEAFCQGALCTSIAFDFNAVLRAIESSTVTYKTLAVDGLDIAYREAGGWVCSVSSWIFPR